MKFINCILLIFLSNLLLSQEVVFWGDQLSGTLNKLTLNTGIKTILVQNQNVIRRVKIDADNQKVFWTEGGQGAIMTCNFNGENVAEVIGTNNNIGVLTLDKENEEIYFSETGSGLIKKCQYDGSNVQILISGVGNVQGVEIDLNSNLIFWTEFDNKVIKKAMLNGNQVETVFQSNSSLFDLALNPENEEIYFSDRTENKIQRISYIGNNLTEIFNSNNLVIGAIDLDLNGQKLSWLERDNGRILISDLNGENISLLINEGIASISGHDLYLEEVVNLENPIDPEKIELQIFPNPGTTTINIKFDNSSISNLELKILDVSGRAIHDEIIDSNNYSIDCNKLNSGSYYFNFRNIENSKIITRKVIISN